MKRIKFLPLAGFASFLCVFTLDSLSYSLEVYSGIYFPIGFLGILIGILLSSFFLFYERLSSALEVIYKGLLLSAFVAVELLVLNSDMATWMDVYEWVRDLGFVASGYYMCCYIIEGGALGRVRWVLPSLAFVTSLGLMVRSNDVDINYLRVADGVGLTYLLSLAILRKVNAWTIAIFLVGALQLFLIGSRAGVILYVISAAAAFARIKPKLVILVVMPLILAGSYFYLQNEYLTATNINEHRLARLAFDSSEDTSLNARSDMQSNAIDVMQKHPFLGDYKYYRRQGDEGAYAHNFISFPAELGMAGWWILFVLLLPQIVGLIKLGRNLTNRHMLVDLLPFFIYSLVGIAAAKAYVWSFFYFATGLGCYLCFSYRGPGEQSCRGDSYS